MSNRSNSSGGVGVAGLLGVAFVVLKLTGVINWSWWLVTRPFWIGLAVVLGIGAIALVAWLITMAVKRLRKMRLRHGASASLVLALLLTGCAGGMFGTGVGDGDVSDGEAAALNIGGEAAGVSGVGTKAQKIRPPSRPEAAEQAAMRFPLLSTTTQYWDSVGTVVKPPIHFRIDPDFGSVTGTYGQAKAQAAPTVDPALVQAVLDALQGNPARPANGGASAPAPAPPATPAAGGDADDAELDSMEAPR